MKAKGYEANGLAGADRGLTFIIQFGEGESFGNIPSEFCEDVDTSVQDLCLVGSAECLFRAVGPDPSGG